MKIQITSWINGSVLFEGDFSCIADAVRAAVKSSADLRYANLSSADLRYANLSSADLSSADLRYANLSSADLSSADLRYANLSSANLSSANLSSANLSSANLSSANLSSANLRSANLRSANLSSANLRYAKNADYAIACTRILPDGDIIGWKKLKGGIVAKLLIPADAKRSHAFGRKCRAEYANVLELWDGKKKHQEPAFSGYEAGFAYEVGKTVKPSAKFDDDFTNECAPGIHFFITKLEAEAYEA
jgi:hypothetical protein